MDAIIDIEDLRKLKLPELKALCKQNKLPSSGAKEALIKRLAVSMGMDDEDEGVDEDALLEDEDELDSKEDTPVSISDKEPSSEPADSNEVTNDAPAAALSASGESPKKQAPLAEEKDKENDTGESPTKKIKLIEAPPADPPKPVSQMTDAERLRLRAEKYGVSTSKGALSSKEARAARFGTAAAKPSAAEKKTPAGKGGAAAAAPKNLSAEDLEKMKQRSQRFGTTVSSTLSSVDNVDKILKRKERFGEVSASSKSNASDDAKEKRAARFGTETTAKTVTSSTEMDALKQKRAERFKTAA